MKSVIAFFLFIVILITSSVAQSFSTGRQVITFTDPSRSNRQVNTEIYYPANSAGNNVPLTSGTDKFPVVVFGHGFVISVSSYAWLADSLVKNGYIVAMPTTESNLSPSHDNFGKDLAFLCTAIISLDIDPSSFLYQRVKHKSAIAGHSMGGGCSFLAAAGNSTTNAIFNFAAAETSPSATTAASLVTRPALIFSGSSDCIVVPTVQQGMYANINSPCKTYININNALHCQFANNNGTCVFGQLTSGCNSSTVTPAIVFNKISQMLLPFLDYYLKDICLRGDDFLVAYANITGVTKASTCNSFPACGVLPVNLLNFYGIATGKTARLSWTVSTEFNLLNYTLEKSNDGRNFKSCMQQLPMGNESSYSVVDLYPYPFLSYYRLKITDKDGSYSYSGIVKVKTNETDIAITGFYPNPVISKLNLELTVLREQKVAINIYSLLGQHLFTINKNFLPGNNEQQIMLNYLAAGSYFLKLTDHNGKTVSSIKFTKE